MSGKALFKQRVKLVTCMPMMLIVLFCFSLSEAWHEFSDYWRGTAKDIASIWRGDA